MWHFTSLLSSARNRRLRASSRPAARRQGARLLVEELEGRALPAVVAPKTFADGPGDGTLRTDLLQANHSAQDGTILLAAGTYTLGAGGELAVTAARHTVTIQGAGARQTVIAAGLSRVFEVIGDVQVVLKDLTLTGGHERRERHEQRRRHEQQHRREHGCRL
jgi:hypothetical protein